MLYAMMKHYNINLQQYVVDDVKQSLIDANFLLRPHFIDDLPSLHLVYFAGPYDVRNGHYEPLQPIDNDNNNSNNENELGDDDDDDDDNNNNDRETVNRNPPQPPPLPPPRVAQPAFRIASLGRPRKMKLIDEFYLYCMYMYMEVRKPINRYFVLLQRIESI